MNSTTKTKHYKYKNIAGTLAVILLCVLALSTSCNSHKAEQDAKLKALESSSSETEDSGVRLTRNYKYLNVRNSEQLGNGNLVIVDNEHPYTGKVPDTEGIYPYLFNSDKKQILYASSTQLYAPADVFSSFNRLADEFYKDTGMATIMISSAYSGDTEDSSQAESKTDDSSQTSSPSSTVSETDENTTGLALDLQCYDSAKGTYPEFTGEGKYSAIKSNAYKYGFVLRYPEDKTDKTGKSGNPAHFRYVGVPFAEIMKNNSLCLEEFSEFVKKYTFENPMDFLTEDGKSYYIYYVRAENGETTNVPIPQDADGSECKYTISGNNIDGYIICVDNNEETADEITEESLPQEDSSSVQEVQ